MLGVFRHDGRVASFIVKHLLGIQPRYMVAGTSYGL